jgi:hypothetical protein
VPHSFKHKELNSAGNQMHSFLLEAPERKTLISYKITY